MMPTLRLGAAEVHHRVTGAGFPVVALTYHLTESRGA